MRPVKHVHLLIPAAARQATRGLNRLLARGLAVDWTPGCSLHTALARLFGLADTPLAPITLAAEGVDPGNDFWLCADPVHLNAGLRHVTLLDHRDLALQPDEAAGLLAALNDHFAAELGFLAPRPTHWYARSPTPLQVVAPTLDAVAGGILPEGAPAGPDAGTLRRIATEVQMLLHAHPINAAREQRGALPVNGVWFWGGGTWQRPPADVAAVLGGERSARALAAAAGCRHTPLPGRFEAGALPEGLSLLVLDGTGADLDATWLRPLGSALRWGRIAGLTVECIGSEALARRLDRRAAWRPWPSAAGDAGV